MGNKLGLNDLKPEGRRKSTPVFTHEEMLEVHAARQRGVSIRQIHEATNRAKTVNAMGAIYRKWKIDNNISDEKPATSTTPPPAALAAGSKSASGNKK